MLTTALYHGETYDAFHFIQDPLDQAVEALMAWTGPAFLWVHEHCEDSAGYHMYPAVRYGNDVFRVASDYLVLRAQDGYLAIPHKHIGAYAEAPKRKPLYDTHPRG